MSGFLRAISATPAMCQYLASRFWLDLLFSIIEAKDTPGSSGGTGPSGGSVAAVTNLPTQILALRLLTAVLPHSLHASAKNQPTMIQERLFHLLGMPGEDPTTIWNRFSTLFFILLPYY